MLCLVALMPCSLALAAPVRAAAAADAATPPALARQQALERAFTQAVMLEAGRILPAPLAEARTAFLRSFLEPRAMELVVSYQEAPGAKPSPATPSLPSGPEANHQPSLSENGQASAPLQLELDVEVNRPALRGILQRFGLLSGGTRTYALRLGPGVAEQDFRALEALNTFMGLTRAPTADLDISLERLPQGYYKGILRQPGNAQAAVIVADGKDLPTLWQNLWGQLFEGREFRPGGASRWLEVGGFASVELVSAFGHVLAGWDESLQNVVILSLDVRQTGIAARWSVRMVDRAKLAARFAEALPPRGLALVRPEVLLGAPDTP